jgi:RNA polymerase sigma-70 factor (ECF subfamily)
MDPVNPKLISECKQGSVPAFRELVLQVSPYAFSVAFRILNDEDEAKNAVQESMIKVWKKLGGFNETGNFKTWIYRIVVHTCFDVLRKQKRERLIRVDDKFWMKAGSVLNEENYRSLEVRESAELLRELTRKLSPVQKSVFVMSELMELEQSEIAEILNIRKSAVKANLYYARKEIQRMMERYL